MGGADWFSMWSADFAPKTSPRIYFPIGQWEDACPCNFACHVTRRKFLKKTKLGDSNLFRFYPINSRECESVSEFSVDQSWFFFSNWSGAWFRKILEFALGLSKNRTDAFLNFEDTTCKVLRLGKITGNSLPSYLRWEFANQAACLLSSILPEIITRMLLWIFSFIAK